MTHEIVQHTADVRVRVTAKTLPELFEESLQALMEVMHPEHRNEETVRDTISIESVDTTALLIDFLNEALLRCHVRQHTYTSASFPSLTTTSLQATLTAVPVARFGEDVKAVTYHEADVRQTAAGGWTTMLVLDI